MTGVHDFVVEQEKFYTEITWRDSNQDVVNLTGLSAEMSIKPSPGQTSIIDLVSGVSVGETGIIITPDLGKISVCITGADMESLTPGSYKYDLVLFSVDRKNMTRLLKGKFKITPGITVPPVV